MSKTTLPNLNALRVFETAARYESFTLAAEALGVTQSAVSKQVAVLEAQLGQPLFLRRHRQIELTAYGAQVAQAARDSLQQLADRLVAIQTDRPLQIRLVCDADFALLWLFARLPRFEAAHPDLRVSIETQVGLSQPPGGGFDVAIAWGRGNWSQCRFRALMRNTVFPVCAADYLGARPAVLEALRSDELIHDQSTFWWQAFFAGAGVEGFAADDGRLYNQTALCLEAAARGDGVTVGDEVTTVPYLQDGRLVAPFGTRLPSPDAYFLLTPSGQDPSVEASALIAWLMDEVAAHRRWWARFWAGTPHAT